MSGTTTGSGLAHGDENLIIFSMVDARRRVLQHLPIKKEKIAYASKQTAAPRTLKMSTSVKTLMGMFRGEQFKLGVPFSWLIFERDYTSFRDGWGQEDKKKAKSTAAEPWPKCEE